MTSHKISTSFLRLGAVFAVAATALGGCSTVKSVSPFGSSVPYAANIQPTIPRPAVTEIPAFKPKPPEPASPPKRAAPAAETPTPAPAAPVAAPATAAPAPAAAEPPAPPPKSSMAEVPAPKIAAAEPRPAPASPPSVPEKTADESAAPASGSEAGDGPSIPADHRKLSEDGAFPNLAQVPARPVNLPSFAEAAALEKTLVSDRDKARDAVPASPEAPSVDSTAVPVAVPQSKLQTQSSMVKPIAVAARAEDRAPCLNGKAVDGQLAATLNFDPGSAALTAGNRAVLAEAVPTIRAAKGTIRIYGHGDADVAAASRFDLAAARAAAVAQAVAGYGIPVPRIAVGVACADAAFAGASVQLYTES
jgi:outer membrane protein OmpA-like peptidoglycan-associated protein